jgi:hypothetical protein
MKEVYYDRRGLPLVDGVRTTAPHRPFAAPIAGLRRSWSAIAPRSARMPPCSPAYQVISARCLWQPSIW